MIQKCALITLFLLLSIDDGLAAFGDRIQPRFDDQDTLIQEESRHRDFNIKPQHVRTEIPITFQAPSLDAPDFWKSSPSRRTIFDFNSNNLLTYPLTKGVNTFYAMMNEFFGINNNNIPLRQKHPYDFQQKFYTPQKPIYVSPPKPVRASIVKLEPVQSLDFPTTVKYYPQFVKLLNDVLIENSYRQQPESYGFDPVIEKPQFYLNADIKPTTYKPKSTLFRLRTTTSTTTTPKSIVTPYPASIQDQLPPISNTVQIPYIDETSSGQNSEVVLSTTPPKLVFPTTAPQKNYTKINTTEAPTVPTASENTTAAPTEQPTTEETTTIPNTTTEFVSESSNNRFIIAPLLNTMETTENTRYLSAFPKKIHSRRVTTETPKETTITVQHITDLTLLGLSERTDIGASLPTTLKTPKANNLTTIIQPRSSYVANLDDELSLDAKILRDTNWDGFQGSTTIPTLNNTTVTNETEIIESRITQSISRRVSNETEPESVEISLLMQPQTVPTPRNGKKLSFAKRKSLKLGPLERSRFPSRVTPKTTFRFDKNRKQSDGEMMMFSDEVGITSERPQRRRYAHRKRVPFVNLTTTT